MYLCRTLLILPRSSANSALGAGMSSERFNCSRVIFVKSRCKFVGGAEARGTGCELVGCTPTEFGATIAEFGAAVTGFGAAFTGFGASVTGAATGATVTTLGASVTVLGAITVLVVIVTGPVATATAVGIAPKWYPIPGDVLDRVTVLGFLLRISGLPFHQNWHRETAL